MSLSQKYRRLVALQQRSNENAKEFLDRCKTGWYDLLRMARAMLVTDEERFAHDDTRNVIIKAAFVSGLRNDVGIAVESRTENMLTIESAVAAADQFESVTMLNTCATRLR